VVAEAEVALAMRDLRASPQALAAASAMLEARADRANALLAGLDATELRAVAELAAGQVRSVGRARAQRWLAPPLAGKR